MQKYPGTIMATICFSSDAYGCLPYLSSDAYHRRLTYKLISLAILTNSKAITIKIYSTLYTLGAVRHRDVMGVLV